MILRGYCIPFNRLGLVNDETASYERVVYGAFDAMLAARNPVALQFGTHGAAPALAKTDDRSMWLFADEHGLAFEADVRDRMSFGQARAMLGPKGFGCSVYFDSGSWSAGIGAADTRIITKASIFHVALVSAPAYRDTAVWRADIPLDAAPSHIIDAADRWEGGAIEARHRGAVANARAASPVKLAAKARSPSMKDPRLELMFASRAKEWGDIRKAFFNYPEGAVGRVFGHPALSKSFGQFLEARRGQ